MNSESNDIQMIPVNRIRIINPRVRDKDRFAEIVKNIETIGLKRPITVRMTSNGDGQGNYEVVCGQGRLEAYMALGQTEIPAVVRNYEKREALLASLVENVARRRVRAIEQIQAIKWMHEQGNNASVIGRKTGLGDRYVNSILKLLKQGETRLLDAALHGRIPISIATRIAETSDDDVQRVLMQAYESGEIKQKTLSTFRRLVQQRRCFGISYGPKTARKRKPSSQVFVSRYRQLADRQKLMIKKARACEARLLALTAAFRTLTGDEDFVNLLRAEKMGTMPKFLAERIKEET